MLTRASTEPSGFLALPCGEQLSSMCRAVSNLMHFQADNSEPTVDPSLVVPGHPTGERPDFGDRCVEPSWMIVVRTHSSIGIR